MPSTNSPGTALAAKNELEKKLPISPSYAMSLKGLRDEGPRDINARWPVWGTSRSGALMARRIPVVLILVLVTTTLSGRTVDPPWSSNALPFSYDDWSSQDWGLWRRGRGLRLSSAH